MKEIVLVVIGVDLRRCGYKPDVKEIFKLSTNH